MKVFKVFLIVTDEKKRVGAYAFLYTGQTKNQEVVF